MREPLDLSEHVASLRRFNRAHTKRIGVLNESYLGSGHALGPSRLLFELGDGPTAIATLRGRLALDSGYLSRLLRHLENAALIEVLRDPYDGRQRIVRLTAAGRREWRVLDRRAARVAEVLLGPLSTRQQAELAAALATADKLLCVSTVTIDRADPASVEAQEAMACYFAELQVRFRDGFDTGAGATSSDAETMSGPEGAFLLMRSDADVVGCGGVLRIDDRTGEIKRMWIHPNWRGHGLGGRLLTRLEATATALGRARVVLDTNESLREAIAMYRQFGYRPTTRYNNNPYAHHWFEKDLTSGRDGTRRVRNGTKEGRAIGVEGMEKV